MSTTDLEVFDRALHKTKISLDNMMEIVGCQRHDAYVILRATCGQFRSRVYGSTHGGKFSTYQRLPVCIGGVRSFITRGKPRTRGSARQMQLTTPGEHMATQTTKTDEKQNQGSQQGQAMTRRSQEQGSSRSSGYLLPYLTPADFFRMNPFSLMRRMSEEMDRVFGESNERESRERTWTPAIELMQREGNLVVRAELPGLNPEDVKLEITDDAIVLQGERKDEREEDRDGLHVTERRYGRFYRAIPLPEGAKTDEVRAKFENGVLEITIPTEEPKSQRREIPIQGASQATKGGSGQNPAGSSQSTGGSEKAA